MLVHEHEHEPYVVRTSWEGTDVNTVTHRHEDDAADDFAERVKYYLNLPDAGLAIAAGTCIQLIHGDDVHREWVA